MTPLPTLRGSPGAARWFIVGLASLLGALAHFGLHRPLINDEAIELQVAEGLPLDRFYFFAPGEAYARGLITPVESFVPYINRALFAVCRPLLTSREAFAFPVRCLHLAALAAGCVTIFEVARRQWGAGMALFAGVCAAGSGYALLMNQFLTRNAITLLWGALVLWLIDGWMRHPAKGGYRWAPACALALLAGCWTYTIFKPFALATYAALFFGWLRFSRRPAELAPIAASAGLFAAGLIAMVIAGGSDLPFYLNRGGYALAGKTEYWHNLILTLATPVYYQMHGAFLEEDVHVMLGRAILSPLLGPFFFIGLIWAFAGRRPGLFVAAALWTGGMFLCATAGPNLKYQLAFFPLTLLLACAGVYAAGHRLPRTLQSTGAALFLTGCVALELYHVFRVFPTSDRYALSRFPPIVVRKGLEEARLHPGAVVLQPNLGYDILNWYLWPPERARLVRAYADTAEMIADLAAQPAPPPVLLLTDYPPESMFAGLKWTPPAGMRIVNVRDEP